MQKSNKALSDIFYDIASSRKILNEIESSIEKLKNGYSDFYKNNIGSIDKIKDTELELYVLKQDREPLGTCTIKLKNNTYIMQKDLGNNNYSYLLFKKNHKIALPYKDEVAMKDIYEKYSKYKPLSKKQLLEKIFDKNKNLLSENKVTKKFFFEADIVTLASKLEDIKIYDLTEALNFYRISKCSKTQLRRVSSTDINSDIKKSKFYKEYKNIQDRIEDLNDTEIFLYLNDLKEKLEQNIFESKIILQKEDKDEHFITKKNFEDLECISMPKAEYMLDTFFDKILDFKKIDLDIYKGILNFEKNISFTFYSPSRTLAELVDKVNSIDFYKNIVKNNEVQNYNKNDVIKLN